MNVLPFLVLHKGEVLKKLVFLKMPQRFSAIFFILGLTLLSKSKPVERLCQIFVAFSEKLKFGQSDNCGLFKWRNND